MASLGDGGGEIFIEAVQEGFGAADVDQKIFILEAFLVEAGFVVRHACVGRGALGWRLRAQAFAAAGGGVCRIEGAAIQAGFEQDGLPGAARKFLEELGGDGAVVGGPARGRHPGGQRAGCCARAFRRGLRVPQGLCVRGFGQLHGELGQPLGLAQMAVAASLAGRRESWGDGVQGFGP